MGFAAHVASDNLRPYPHRESGEKEALAMVLRVGVEEFGD